MASYCRSCGIKLPDSPGRFCRDCGLPIDTEAGEPAKPPGKSPQSPDKSPKPAGKKTNRWPLFAAAVLLVALAIGAALLLIQKHSTDSSSSTSSLPSPQDLPPNVALVTHVPSSMGMVTRSDFNHAMEQAAAQSGLKAVPVVGSKKFGELKESTLESIFDAIWLQGQAAELGIRVTPTEISAELAKLKKEAFKTDAEYQHFLGTSHYTTEDVNERVKLQLLGTRIQQQIDNKTRPPKPQISAQLVQRARQEALTKFIANYNRRWRSRTVCAPAFVIERCSNGRVKSTGAGGSTPGAGDTEAGNSIPGVPGG